MANFLRDSDEPVDINQLGSGPIASARWMFDEATGVEASDLTPDEIERWRPAVYEHLVRESGDTPFFMKTHDAFTRNAQGEPVISKAATRGAHRSMVSAPS